MIPTIRRPELVRSVVESVLADPATVQVVVVVDGVDAATSAALAPIAAADDRLLVTATGAGGPALERGQRAREHGVRLATGKVVLALDDDVVPTGRLVSGHADWHAGADDLVVQGYMPVLGDRRRLSGPARLYARGYERTCARFTADPSHVLRSLWGGNVSACRDNWLAALDRPAAGGAYHGDLELGLRFGQAGLRAIFDPRLRADHWYTRSLGQLVDDARGSAVGQLQLHEAYPAIVDHPRRAVPATRAAAALAIVTRPAASWAVARTALQGLSRAASGLHLDRIEDRLVRALWRLSFERAVHQEGSRR